MKEFALDNYYEGFLEVYQNLFANAIFKAYPVDIKSSIFHILLWIF